MVGKIEVASDASYLPVSDEGREDKKPSEPVKKALATPVARAMAREFGLDINEIPGTGPGGPTVCHAPGHRVTGQETGDADH